MKNPNEISFKLNFAIEPHDGYFMDGHEMISVCVFSSGGIDSVTKVDFLGKTQAVGLIFHIFRNSQFLWDAIGACVCEKIDSVCESMKTSPKRLEIGQTVTVVDFMSGIQKKVKIESYNPHIKAIMADDEYLYVFKDIISVEKFEYVAKTDATQMPGKNC